MKIHPTTQTVTLKQIPSWWKKWFEIVRSKGINCEIPVTEAFKPDWAIMQLINFPQLEEVRRIYFILKEDEKI